MVRPSGRVSWRHYWRHETAVLREAGWPPLGGWIASAVSAAAAGGLENVMSGDVSFLVPVAAGLVVLLAAYLVSLRRANVRIYADQEAEIERLRGLGADVEKIRDLKAAAGRVTDAFAFPDMLRPSPATPEALDDFRSLYGELREHEVIYRRAVRLERLLRYCASGHGTGEDHEKAAAEAESTCGELVAACTEMIRPPRGGGGAE
jgi:hypothetical protein